MCRGLVCAWDKKNQRLLYGGSSHHELINGRDYDEFVFAEAVLTRGRGEFICEGEGLNTEAYVAIRTFFQIACGDRKSLVWFFNRFPMAALTAGDDVLGSRGKRKFRKLQRKLYHKMDRRFFRMHRNTAAHIAFLRWELLFARMNNRAINWLR